MNKSITQIMTWYLQNPRHARTLILAFILVMMLAMTVSPALAGYAGSSTY